MKRMFEIWEMWDWLIDNGIATEDELKLITKMNGYNIYTLNDVLYYRTGYHDREKWKRKKQMKNFKLSRYKVSYTRDNIDCYAYCNQVSARKLISEHGKNHMITSIIDTSTGKEIWDK